MREALSNSSNLVSQYIEIGGLVGLYCRRHVDEALLTTLNRAIARGGDLMRYSTVAADLIEHEEIGHARGYDI